MRRVQLEVVYSINVMSLSMRSDCISKIMLWIFCTTRKEKRIFTLFTSVDKLLFQ